MSPTAPIIFDMSAVVILTLAIVPAVIVVAALVAWLVTRKLSATRLQIVERGDRGLPTTYTLDGLFTLRGKMLGER